jgi:hypothetical protein
VTAEQAAERYMLAWVRLHAATDPDGWSWEQVREAFHLLPLPVRSLDAWARAAGLEIEAPVDVAAVNRAGLMALRAAAASGLAPVTIEEETRGE